MKGILTIALFTFIFCSVKAQQINQQPGQALWQNAILRADGFTEVDGVEAYCQKTICNGESYILIRFVNKNDQQVALEWVDAIYVNGNWYYSNLPLPKKIYVPAGSTVSGDCQGEIKLKAAVSSILEQPLEFNYFTVSGLKVTK